MGSSILRAGWSYLPERKGLVSGVVMSGYSLGGFTCGMASQFLANPDKLKFEIDPQDQKMFLPKEVGENVPFMLRVILLAFAL